MHSLEKYIGRKVDMIYMDRNRRITKRTVSIRLVNGDTIHTYCHERRACRQFKREQILALAPASGEWARRTRTTFWESANEGDARPII